MGMNLAQMLIGGAHQHHHMHGQHPLGQQKHLTMKRTVCVADVCMKSLYASAAVSGVYRV